MHHPAIETVIFDFGGVLIDWNPNYLYEKIIPDAERRKWFLTEICSPHWNEEQDAGRPIAEATQLLTDQYPALETEIRAFYGRWTEMLGGPIHESVTLLENIRDKGQHRLYGLTNWSAETFPIAWERYDFLRIFEGIIVSGKEKTRKPFPEIYQLILDRYNIKAETAVFIDDNARNVKAAGEMGIQTIYFQSPEQLRNDLVKMDVL